MAGSNTKTIGEALEAHLPLTIGVASAVGLLVVLLLIILICIIVYCCWKRRRARGSRYRRLRSNSGQPLVTSFSPSSNNQQNGRTSGRTTTTPRGNRGSTGAAGRGSQGGGGGIEVGLYEAMQRQREEQEATRRETGLLNCQYYLRSNQKYVMETHLSDIGSRISKNWFIVRPIGATQHTSPYLLTMLPVSQQCRLNLQSSDKHILNKLIKVIEHPCIHKITSIDYIPDKRLIVVLEPFVQRGSLKDIIYQTTPSLSWSTKYSVRRSGLRVHQIQNFGRQILEAVLFLHDSGLDPLGQIQTGNIYIEGGRCKLSGIDNSLLGYKPRIYRIIKQCRENLDSVMFGHLIFELVTGRELSSLAPTDSDYESIKIQPVIEVLQFIFQQPSPPTITEIYQMEFFQNAQVSSREQITSREGSTDNEILLDEDMNALIYKSRKGRTRPQMVKKTRNQSGGGASSYTEGIHPSSPSNTTVLMSTSAPRPIAQTPSKTTTKTGPKTSTPLPRHSSPPAQPRPPPTSTDRSALLSDIHKGKSLRHTETNDRSAPILK